MSINYKHEAVVTKLLNNKQMIVDIARTSACESCSMSGGCGVSSESPKNSFEVENTVNAKIGDSIIITMQQDKLYKSAAIVYILPLLAMLAVALIVETIFHKEIYTAVSSLGTLVMYFISLKLFMKNKKSDLQVYINT